MERKINKVKIFTNSSEKTKVVTDKLIKALEEYNFEIVEENYDLAISIGGDGTFLHMLNKANFNEKIYYVGINTGSLGFLQEIDLEKNPDFVERLNNNHYDLEDIYLEEITVTTKDQTINYTALNEMVVRDKKLKVLECIVEVKEELLETFIGDGLLISTNTGSTAYNVSLGGSIISKDLLALSLTPIAPLKNKIYHSLSNPLIVSHKQTIGITPKNKNLVITLDGMNHELEDVIKIEAKIGNKKIKRLKLEDTNFIKIIRDKILGNEKEGRDL